jgi:hypothetical protein
MLGTVFCLFVCLFVSVNINHTGLLEIAAEINAEQYKVSFF